MKKRKYFKEKKQKSFYGKWLNPILLLYVAYFCLCCLPIVIVMATVPYDEFETALYITVAVVGAAFLAGSAAFVFVVINRLKRAQARKDFARYDFAPYASTADEIFECDYHVCRYTVAASPFDEDVTTEFKTVENAKEFIAQHFAQELRRMDDFYQGMDKSPFFIGYFFDGSDGISVRIDRKTDGETTTLDLTERHRAVFTDDGLKVGEKLYPYSALEAELVAGFGNDTDFFVNVRLLIILEDAGVLSFEFSSRIAETVKRFGIKIVNRDKFDYVLADPLHALEQTALQLGLRKLK